MEKGLCWNLGMYNSHWSEPSRPLHRTNPHKTSLTTTGFFLKIACTFGRVEDLSLEGSAKLRRLLPRSRFSLIKCRIDSNALQKNRSTVFQNLSNPLSTEEKWGKKKSEELSDPTKKKTEISDGTEPKIWNDFPQNKYMRLWNFIHTRNNTLWNNKLENSCELKRQI